MHLAKTVMSFLARGNESSATPLFADIPSAPGGALAVGRHPDTEQLLHGVMQASVVSQPGAVFLLGLSEELVKARYPTAQRLTPVEGIGKVSMTPSSAFTILRVLCGDSTLADYLMELVFLEHAGEELSKPGPLAMIPSWAEEQLAPSNLMGLLCGLQRSEATVGGAFKSLMANPNFKFAMLDELKTAAASGSISHAHKHMFDSWSAHCQQVVTALRETIDNPPLCLKLLPSIRDAQELNSPNVWYVSNEDLAEIAPTLDALVLSHGLRQRHHWFVDVPTLSKANHLGLNALARLGASLWQHRDAREHGYGPALWCHLGDEIPNTSGVRGYAHRCAQGSSVVLGQEQELIPSLLNALPVEETAFDWEHSPERFGMYRVADARYRHMHDTEIAAIKHHVDSERHIRSAAPLI